MGLNEHRAARNPMGSSPLSHFHNGRLTWAYLYPIFRYTHI